MTHEPTTCDSPPSGYHTPIGSVVCLELQNMEMEGQAPSIPQHMICAPHLDSLYVAFQISIKYITRITTIHCANLLLLHACFCQAEEFGCGLAKTAKSFDLHTH